MRIEVDGDENHVLQVGSCLGVVEDLVVAGVVKADPKMRLERRIGPADVVEPSDLGDDVAGRIPVPGADLVFLGAEIFLAARQRARLAQLKPAIDTKQPGEGGAERGADQEPRSTGGLEKDRI